MKLRKRHEHEVEVGTEALSDIMFFLMLFFLIVSTFANPNVIKLMLPKSASSQNIAKKQITLSVTKDKQYFIDNQPIAFEQLEAALSGMQSKVEDITIIVRTDYELQVQDLVDVLQIGNKLKVKMVLATKK
jgi:biopolymer transport protein ExbD